METFSDRLKFALELTKTTQSELARKVGLKRQIIQYLCTGNPKASRYSYLVAHALEINHEWLVTGEGSYSLEEENEEPLLRVPFLTYSQIKKIACRQATISELQPKHWEKTAIGMTENQSFATELLDKSMFPRCDEGSILFFDMLLSPKVGKVVIAYDQPSDAILIRELVEVDNNLLLLPLNDKLYKTIKLKKEVLLLATMTEFRWRE